ncbi:MAG: hypothetical protein U0793_25185 [Gemmataceae bacterium]
MTRLLAAVSISLVGLILVTSGADSGDKEKDKEKKFKGMLPPGWKALKLEKDQITKIYAVQKMYRGKIQDLEDQIIALRAHERMEMVKVLTDDQKALLRKLTTGDDVKEKKVEKEKAKEK